MSTPSISPLPTAAPDLSQIRQTWRDKFQHMPSFPDTRPTQPASSIHPQPTEKSEDPTGIPSLPTLGAMATQAVLSMDGLDRLLHPDQYTDSPPETPSTSSDTPYSPSTYDPPQTPTQHPRNYQTRSNPIKIPDMPQITVPEPNNPGTNKTKKTLDKILTAMPSVAPPEISIPLVRDQHAAPVSENPPPKATIPPFAAAPPPASDKPKFTDDDLRAALRPILDPCIDKFLYTPSHGIHSYLEPMLRSTVRRAIAEQMDDASPFREVSGWDRFAWKLRAIIGSRTYDDIVFDHTKRYQVEEVFLLRPHSRSLISYASHDPSRHTKPAKIQGTVKKIAAKTSDKKNEDATCIKWEGTRNLMIRRGEHSILAAVVHGPSNAILRSDLDYTLRQAEERFGKTLEDENDIHLQILQPLLEGCLLIQSPAIPN